MLTVCEKYNDPLLKRHICGENMLPAFFVVVAVVITDYQHRSVA